MKNTASLLLTLIAHITIAQAYDEAFYTELFLKTDHTRNLKTVRISSNDHGPFAPSQDYKILVVYKDGSPHELYDFNFQQSNQSFYTLFRPSIPLKVINNGVLKNIPKNRLAYFVLDDMIFMNDKKDKVVKDNSNFKGKWGVLIINGPASITRYLQVDPVNESLFVSDVVKKGDEVIASVGEEQLKSFINGTKNILKIVSDNQAIADKVSNKEEGYTSDDYKKILLEYNESIKQKDPSSFAASALPGIVQKGFPIKTTVDSYQGYDAFFNETDHSHLNTYTFLKTNLGEPNDLVDSSKPSELLVLFNNGQPALEIPYEFVNSGSYHTGFGHLFDPSQDKITYKQNDETKTIDKKELEGLVVNNQYYFVRDQETGEWGVVLFNGPVKAVKWYRYNGAGQNFYTNTSSYLDGELLNFDLAHPVAGWKKKYISLLSDNEELVTKISNKESGYRYADAYKMIAEYNNWVKQNDPGRYDTRAIPASYKKLEK